MKILSADQIRWLDQYTIENKPISSIDLMEDACRAVVRWISNNIEGNKKIQIFTGPGNNGGDGFGIGRLLHQETDFNVEIVTCFFNKPCSRDCQINLDRARLCDGLAVVNFGEHGKRTDIIIDALFGSGLDRPILPPFEEVITFINQSSAPAIAIDLPSGVFLDKMLTGSAVRATYSLTFQVPKLCFLLPSLHEYIGNWHLLNIGLLQKGLDNIESANHYVTLKDAMALYQPKAKFDHKGSNGRLLVVAGSDAMPGAAILTTEAGFRSGAGYVIIHSTSKVCDILIERIPEAILSKTTGKAINSFPDVNANAIALGPGIGVSEETSYAILDGIQSSQGPMVIDADALNIIASNKEILEHLPKASILTPHIREFERLFGKADDDFDRIDQLRIAAKKYAVNIILKGAHTAIATPKGEIYFNSTGNPGMATAGSGDVLTGIIGSLLSQQYNPSTAAILGVFLHGLSGDLAKDELGSFEGMKATDLINFLPKAFGIIAKQYDET